MADDTPAEIQLTDKETLDATKQGLKDAVAEKTKIAQAEFDGLPGEPPSEQYHGWDEIQQWANLLDLGNEAFEEKIGLAAGKEGSVPDEKVYGLLALERNGQNRTPYVKAMVKRLGLKVKDAADLPGGGPGYTNDVTNITSL